MKSAIALLLTVSLLLSGCTAFLPSVESSATFSQKDAVDHPLPPTGTDSTTPAPEIGPEGLPTPTL